MISIKTIYYSLAAQIKGICDKAYYQDRPKAVKDRPNSYIVISLPSNIRNMEIGQRGEYNDYHTTAQIEIYVKDKQSSNNPNAVDINMMDDKVTKVLELFPIKDGKIVVTKPVITLDNVSDGDGFHVTFIQGNLRTK